MRCVALRYEFLIYGHACKRWPYMLLALTGATGFIGQHLRRALAERGFDDRGAVRSARSGLDPRSCVVGDIGPSTDWSAALRSLRELTSPAGP